MIDPVTMNLTGATGGSYGATANRIGMFTRPPVPPVVTYQIRSVLNLPKLWGEWLKSAGPVPCDDWSWNDFWTHISF